MLVEDAAFPSLSRDEQWIAYVKSSNSGDLYAMNLSSGRQVAIDTTAMNTNDPAISPNARYIAYSQDPRGGLASVSAEQRIFVRSFPDGEFRTQLTDEFSDDPFWSADGKTLYYQTGTVLKKIDVETDGAFRPLSSPGVVQPYVFRSRMSVYEGSDRILIKHEGESLAVPEEATMEVSFNFSTYLDRVLPEDN